jgi:hypothetical protein
MSNTNPQPEPSGPANMADRRRSARVEIIDRLQGVLVSHEMEIIVRDISAGGMAIEGPVQFPVGARHEFLLTAPDGSFSRMRGIARYSRRVSPPDAKPSYSTGFEFIETPVPLGGSTIARLIEKIDKGS